MFVLSGEDLTLPYGEINALISSYSDDPKIERLGNRVIRSTNLSSIKLIETITERAAYCRFGGSFVSISQDLPSLASPLEIDLSAMNKSFAVSSFSLDLEKCGELGANIKSKTKGKVSLENPDYVFDVESVPVGRFILGLSTNGYKEFHWRARRPRARKFFLPSAIYPKLARCLVNLSRVKEGEIFLDPFCGTGSLLIESSLMGMRSVGIDITRWIARGAEMNLNGFSLPYESIIRSDSASSLPLTNVDGISTDVPYGRASSTKGLSTSEILNGFLSTASQSMHSSAQKRKFCVVMYPSTIDLEEKLSSQGNSFQLREQHLLYVHRNLTRAISVLERT
jgi:tRNA (guanine10-N2)-dimethyltransferase